MTSRTSWRSLSRPQSNISAGNVPALARGRERRGISPRARARADARSFERLGSELERAARIIRATKSSRQAVSPILERARERDIDGSLSKIERPTRDN